MNLHQEEMYLLVVLVIINILTTGKDVFYVHLHAKLALQKNLTHVYHVLLDIMYNLRKQLLNKLRIK